MREYRNASNACNVHGQFGTEKQGASWPTELVGPLHLGAAPSFQRAGGLPQERLGSTWALAGSSSSSPFLTEVFNDSWRENLQE